MKLLLQFPSQFEMEINFVTVQCDTELPLMCVLVNIIYIKSENT